MPKRVGSFGLSLEFFPVRPAYVTRGPLAEVAETVPGSGDAFASTIFAGVLVVVMFATSGPAVAASEFGPAVLALGRVSGHSRVYETGK